VLRPEVVGDERQGLPARSGVGAEVAPPAPIGKAGLAATLISTLGILAIVVGVLGGIWFGFFTPTEGAGAGAFMALILALIKGVRGRGVVAAILAVGRTSAPILLLLLAAALYSRTLAMTGVTNAVHDFFLSTGLSPPLILACMVVVWFILGMVIDSISIMLLTVPIFEPLAVQLGYDPLGFAIVGILAIEAGLLTPPFGLLVYTVKAAIQDDTVSIVEIFASSAPYWLIMLAAVVMIACVPQIATYLPELLF
jgi:C4-dicarboxylate transporter, DctM subunit